jgi:hypothetical protein
MNLKDSEQSNSDFALNLFSVGTKASAKLVISVILVITFQTLEPIAVKSNPPFQDRSMEVEQNLSRDEIALTPKFEKVEPSPDKKASSFLSHLRGNINECV